MIIYPKYASKENEANLFYPCSEKGMLLVELVKDRRQKVVKIPPFLDNPRAELLTTMPTVGPVRSKPKGRHYGYFDSAGLRLAEHLTFQKPRFKWIENVEDYPEKPFRFPVMGNYAKEIKVVKDEVEVCHYIVVARTMASNLDDLNRQMVKHKDTITILHVSGKACYLPKGYKVQELKIHGWVCDGFYFTDSGLYIEPVKYYSTPTKIDEGTKEVRFKIPGKKGIFSVAKEAFSGLRYLAYRSVNGLQTKVTNQSIHL